MAQVNTISIGITAIAGDRTFHFRDVGADVVQIKPDGTLVLFITGQVLFEIAGVLKIDPETEGSFLSHATAARNSSRRRRGALRAEPA